MKNNSRIAKHALSAVAIGILASSSLCMAATYSKQNTQKNGIDNLDIFAPIDNETKGSSSFLKELEQAQKNKKKSGYLEAFNLIKQNKLEEASNKISVLLKENPNEAEFYNLQAMVDTLKKDASAAQQNYEKAIKLDPRNIMANLGMAKWSLDLGQFDKAIVYAEKVVAINEKNIPAYLILADVAYKQKDNAQVEKVLLTALEKNKGDITAEIEVIKNLGKYYAHQKQPEKILSISEDLVKRYPDNSTALSVLAGAQVVNDQKPLAEETLKKIIAKDRQDIKARLFLAKLMSEQPGRDQEVLKLLDETAQISPKNPEALVFKANYLIKLKRNEEALELATKIDKQFPKLAVGKILTGDVYLAEKNLDKAIAAYQQAYAQQPTDKVLFAFTDLMIAQGKRTDAIQVLNKALEKNNKDAHLHFKLATIYQQQKDNKQAEEHYQAILDLQPHNVLALNNLAFLYFNDNNPRALELAKKAYEYAPQSAPILDTYGHILVKQGQAKEGLPLLEKAAALAPKAAVIQFHLAEAYAANNDNQKAIDILATLVKAEKDFPEKKEAVSLLEKLKSQ